jgi:enediyne polyketide synthase
MEQCAERNEGAWTGLLGEQWLSVAQMIASESNISFQDAAAQVWALKESLRKCGALFDQHLQIDTRTPDGWTTLVSGGLRGATLRISIQGFEEEFAFAFVTRQAP